MLSSAISQGISLSDVVHGRQVGVTDCDPAEAVTNSWDGAEL
jgi:hypothetical protein